MNRIAKQTPPRQTGFSLIEMMIVIAIILIIVSIAIPNFHKAQITAHQMAAMRTIAALQTAEAQYYTQYGEYAGSLAELGPPASGASGHAAADLIPARLAATGEASGYKFVIAPNHIGYTISASPLAFGTTGERTFFSDQSLALHCHDGPEPASAADPEAK